MQDRKHALAEEWTKEFGHQIKPEDINCVGCLVLDGPHINYCNICEIRNCGTKKKAQNCAYCVEYKCEKLTKFHENVQKPKNNWNRYTDKPTRNDALHPVTNIGHVLTETYFSRRIDF